MPQLVPATRGSWSLLPAEQSYGLYPLRSLYPSAVEYPVEEVSLKLTMAADSPRATAIETTAVADLFPLTTLYPALSDYPEAAATVVTLTPDPTQVSTNFICGEFICGVATAGIPAYLIVAGSSLYPETTVWPDTNLDPL